MARMSSATVIAAVALALTCTVADEPRGEMTIRLDVPREVAEHAAARTRGDASSPPPILVLEKLVVGAGEGFTLEIYGTDETLLAVSGLVGPRQAELAEPVERMTIVVPLNDEGSRLVAGRSEIELTLRLRDSPGRPPLQFERAYFQSR